MQVTRSLLSLVLLLVVTVQAILAVSGRATQNTFGVSVSPGKKSSLLHFSFPALTCPLNLITKLWIKDDNSNGERLVSLESPVTISASSFGWTKSASTFYLDALRVRGGSEGTAQSSMSKAVALLGILPGSDRKQSRKLEKQIALMDKQLRQSLQELSNLKSQQAKRGRTRQKYQKRQSQPDTATTLKVQIEALEKQVQNLQALKQSLESMLVERQKYVQSLEEQLSVQREQTQQTKDHYQEELETLQQELESNAQSQWHGLQDTLKERIAQAAASAHEAVVSTLDKRVQGAAQSVREDTLERLEQERQRSVNVVAKQRAKMRALAKALAVREKKLHSLELQRRVEYNQERKRQEQQAMEEQLQREKQELLAKMEEAKATQNKYLEGQQKEEAAAAAAAEAKRLASETKKTTPQNVNQGAAVHKGECWRRRVLWQPMTLPPSNTVKISFTDS